MQYPVDNFTHDYFNSILDQATVLQKCRIGNIVPAPSCKT